jgi:hypothetical protein
LGNDERDRAKEQGGVEACAIPFAESRARDGNEDNEEECVGQIANELGRCHRTLIHSPIDPEIS